MARYPGAVWRPLDSQFVPSLRIVRHNRINHHVVAGYGSPWAFFNHTGRASAHFWVSKTGLVEQYQDTDLRSEADLHGNDATISIETESKGEAWTEAQLNAIIALDDWLCNTHGIRRSLAVNSQIGESSWGLSWHRLGINGNFPQGRYAGRLQLGGGMLYSTATGKTCPVEPVIDQIIDRVYPALNGGVVIIPPIVIVDNPLPPVVEPPKLSTPQIDEDGQWGGDTTGRMQDRSGTGRDRVISNQYKSKYNENIYSAEFNKTLKGSALGRWIQTRLQALGLYGGPIDGLLGHDSIVGLQRYYGTPQDGIISPSSTVVRAAQHELNTKNTFLGL